MNALERVKEDLKAKGFGDIEFPDDVLMRVAGAAEAVLVHKWGRQLDAIAKHCKHSVITEEDVDLLFAHDPDFVGRVETLADTYDDPVDELAVADKKPKSTAKSGSRESTKSPAAVRAVMDEEEDEAGDEEENAGPLTSPEPVVRVAIGPKTVVRVPSFGDVSKPSSSMTSPKPNPMPASPFSKPIVRSPFNRPAPSTPSRFTSPQVPRPIVPSAATTSPVVRPYPPQRAFRSTAPGASPFRPNQPQNTVRPPPQPQNPVRPTPLISPTVQRFRTPAPQSAFRPSTSGQPAPTTTPHRFPAPQSAFRPSTSRPPHPSPTAATPHRSPFRTPVPAQGRIQPKILWGGHGKGGPKGFF